MRPVTNRGLRRKRPPRSRATWTRIVSSPLPSLPTDPGAGYMSLSTRPFPCRFARARESAIRVPTSVHHRPLEYVVDGADREDRNRSTRRAVDSRRPDELHAVLVVEILDEQHRIAPRPLTEAVDRSDAEHILQRGRDEVAPAGRGNRVDRIVLWGCCTGAAGALSRVPARPTPRPPAAAAPPAAETELDQIPPGPRSRRLRIVVLRQSRSLRSSRIGAGERKCADRL